MVSTPDFVLQMYLLITVFTISPFSFTHVIHHFHPFQHPVFSFGISFTYLLKIIIFVKSNYRVEKINLTVQFANIMDLSCINSALC